MKKHQKVLLGLMALGLAGGIGTTLALTRNAADQSSISGGTDQAIYLNWGSGSNTNVVTELETFEAQVSQKRYLVVSPKATNKLSGTVAVKFDLTVADDHVITGLTIDVYSTESYKKEDPVTSTLSGDTSVEGPDTLLTTLKTGTLTYSDSITVNGANTETANPTKYYTLVFTWDGSDVETGKTFGASLKISQSFTAAN